MRAYRCYFLNKDGRITAVEIIYAADDDAARRVALELQRQRGCFAAEVWDEGRRVLQSFEASVR